jgi:hypothetical protein
MNVMKALWLAVDVDISMVSLHIVLPTVSASQGNGND